MRLLCSSSVRNADVSHGTSACPCNLQETENATFELLAASSRPTVLGCGGDLHYIQTVRFCVDSFAPAGAALESLHDSQAELSQVKTEVF